MKKFTIFWLSQLAFLLIFSAISMAQTPEQSHLYVVTGGAFSNPNDFVEITQYDPQTTDNVPIGTIYTHAVQEAKIHENTLYVAATDSLVAYDLVSETRLAATAVSGANLLEVVGDDLFMSVQYPETSGFLKVFDRNTLELKATVEGISGETAGIVVSNDKLFVAVPGAYGSTEGSVAVIDAITYELIEEINMGEGGIGVYNLYVYEGQILTVNKTPWGGTTGNLSMIDPETYSFINYNFEHIIGKGIVIIDGFLYLVLNNGVGIIDLDAMVVAVDLLIEDPGSANFIAFGDIAFDSLHNYFYVTKTDFATFGNGSVYDISGSFVRSFPAGISAEALAVNYTTYTSLEVAEATEVMVYPNPAKDFIRIKQASKEKVITVKIISMQGDLVLSQQLNNETSAFDISALASGIYFIQIQFDNGSRTTRKIVKQ